MVAFADNNQWPQPFSAIVRHGFERQSRFVVIIDRSTKPPKEWADVSRLRIFAIDLEILFLMRNPNAPAEFMLVIVDGNLDDPANKAIASLDDTKVLSEKTLRVAGEAVRPMVRSLGANMRKIIMHFAAHGTLVWHNLVSLYACPG